MHELELKPARHMDKRPGRENLKFLTLRNFGELLEVKAEENYFNKIRNLFQDTSEPSISSESKDIKDMSEVQTLELVLDKDKLIGQYLELTGEKQKLQECHSILQLKLSDRLKSNTTSNDNDDKSPYAQRQQGNNKYVEELMQQFTEELSTYASTKQEIQLAQEHFHKILSKKSEECQSRRSLVCEKKNRLQELKRNAAIKIVTNNDTKNEFEKLLTGGEEKEKEIESIRLRNIRLKMAITKLEAHLRLKDKVAGTLNILDFEQLKLDNLANTEKIEERNEEVLKLKSKISTSAQILTHSKEKLYFLEKMLTGDKEELADIEKLLAQKRDEMCRMKHARDSLRKNNDRLKVSGGILDNDLLLRDYEDCADNCEQMRSMLERLKQTYSAIKKQITSPM